MEWTYLERWHPGSLDVFIGFGAHRKNEKVWKNHFFVESVGERQKIIEKIMALPT